MPTKNQLYDEAMRRYIRMSLPNSEAPQRTRWSKSRIERWLKDHPNTNPDDVEFLQGMMPAQIGEEEPVRAESVFDEPLEEQGTMESSQQIANESDQLSLDGDDENNSDRSLQLFLGEHEDNSSLMLDSTHTVSQQINEYFDNAAQFQSDEQFMEAKLDEDHASADAARTALEPTIDSGWPVPESESKDPGRDQYVQPTEHDVLIVNDARTYKHAGTKRFFDEVRRLQNLYQPFSNEARQDFSQVLVANVLNNGGRFLRMSQSSDKWSVASKNEALRMASEALSEQRKDPPEYVAARTKIDDSSCRSYYEKAGRKVSKRRRVLLAMSIGMSFEPKLKASLGDKLQPAKKDLFEEMERRIHRSSLSSSTSKLWNQKELYQWLTDHPITNSEDINFVQSAVVTFLLNREETQPFKSDDDRTPIRRENLNKGDTHNDATRSSFRMSPNEESASLLPASFNPFLPDNTPTRRTEAEDRIVEDFSLSSVSFKNDQSEVKGSDDESSEDDLIPFDDVLHPYNSLAKVVDNVYAPKHAEKSEKERDATTNMLALQHSRAKIVMGQGTKSLKDAKNMIGRALQDKNSSQNLLDLPSSDRKRSSQGAHQIRKRARYISRSPCVCCQASCNEMTRQIARAKMPSFLVGARYIETSSTTKHMSEIRRLLSHCLPVDLVDLAAVKTGVFVAKHHWSPLVNRFIEEKSWDPTKPVSSATARKLGYFSSELQNPSYIMVPNFWVKDFPTYRKVFEASGKTSLPDVSFDRIEGIHENETNNVWLLLDWDEVSISTTIRVVARGYRQRLEEDQKKLARALAFSMNKTHQEQGFVSKQGWKSMKLDHAVWILRDLLLILEATDEQRAGKEVHSKATSIKDLVEQGKAHFENGRLEQSLWSFTSALYCGHSSPSDNSPEFHWSNLFIARVLTDKGWNNRAKVYLKSVEEVSSSTLPKELLAEVEICKSKLWIHEGHYEKAEKALSMATELVQANSMIWARVCIHLGEVARRRGHLEKDYHYLQEAENCFRSDTLSWTQFCHACAALLKDEGKKDSALHDFLTPAKKYLLGSHSNSIQLAVLHNAIAFVQLESGDIENALTELNSARHLLERVAPVSTEFAMTLHGLAKAKHQQGLNEEALLNIESARSCQNSSADSGDTDPNTDPKPLIRSEINALHSEILLDQNRPSEAQDKLDEPISEQEMLFSIPYANTLRVNARVKQAKHDLVEALKIQERAETILDSKAPFSVHMGELCRDIAWVLRELKRSEEALEYAERARMIFSLEAPKSISAATNLNILGRILFEMKRFDECKDCYFEADRILQVLGCTHPVKCSVLNNIAALHHEEKDYDRALQAATQSVKILEQNKAVLGIKEDHPVWIDSQLQVGQALFELDLLEESLQSVTQILKARPMDKDALELKAKILDRQGRHGDAKENRRLALQIDRNFGDAAVSGVESYASWILQHRPREDSSTTTLRPKKSATGELSDPTNTQALSQVAIDKDGETRKQVIGVTPSTSPFPQRLMAILADSTLNGIISWLPHGRSFVVTRPKIFVEKVLPKYIPSSSPKFPPFVHELNRWGFRQVNDGPEIGAFRHPLFRRDQPSLCLEMVPQSSRKQQSRTEVQDEESSEQATSGGTKIKFVEGGAEISGPYRNVIEKLSSLTGVLTETDVRDILAEVLVQVSSHISNDFPIAAIRETTVEHATDDLLQEIQRLKNQRSSQAKPEKSAPTAIETESSVQSSRVLFVRNGTRRNGVYGDTIDALAKIIGLIPEGEVIQIVQSVIKKVSETIKNSLDDVEVDEMTMDEAVHLIMAECSSAREESIPDAAASQEKTDDNDEKEIVLFPRDETVESSVYGNAINMLSSFANDFSGQELRTTVQSIVRQVSKEAQEKKETLTPFVRIGLDDAVEAVLKKCHGGGVKSAPPERQAEFSVPPPPPPPSDRPSVQDSLLVEFVVDGIKDGGVYKTAIDMIAARLSILQPAEVDALIETILRQVSDELRRLGTGAISGTAVKKMEMNQAKALVLEACKKEATVLDETGSE